MKYPFVHEELEVKQSFLNIARDFAKSPDLEKQFAAALVYANLADYLGMHLHESLKLACHNATRTFYNGVLVISVKDESDKPMGKVIQGLEGFLFPGKDLILPLMRNIKKNRDKVMHGLVKSPSKELLGTLDNTLKSLIEDVEQLVIYVDDIYRSLPPKTVLESLSNGPAVEDPNTAEDPSENGKNKKKVPGRS